MTNPNPNVINTRNRLALSLSENRASVGIREDSTSRGYIETLNTERVNVESHRTRNGNAHHNGNGNEYQSENRIIGENHRDNHHSSDKVEHIDYNAPPIPADEKENQNSNNMSQNEHDEVNGNGMVIAGNVITTEGTNNHLHNNPILHYQEQLERFEVNNEIEVIQNPSTENMETLSNLRGAPLSQTKLSSPELCGVDFPKVSVDFARFVLALNILLPGVGTFAAGCASEKKEASTFIMIGIIQLLFCILLIGWVWSIALGVQLLDYSVLLEQYNEKQEKKEEAMRRESNN